MFSTLLLLYVICSLVISDYNAARSPRALLAIFFKFLLHFVSTDGAHVLIQILARNPSNPEPNKRFADWKIFDELSYSIGSFHLGEASL